MGKSSLEDRIKKLQAQKEKADKRKELKKQIDAARAALKKL
jgi:chromosome segregation ATPase